MASNNLMAMEQPWMFRADAWISDIFTKENDTLAKALHKSISTTTTSSDGDAFSAEMVESLFANPDTAVPLQTPTASGASENDAPRRRTIPPTGRVTKRKSRSSKRATTTFITADPANFRQMVQQVTGVSFGGQLPVLKPEPQRAVNRIQQASGLPTLDTSAFFLDGSAASLVAAPHMSPAMGGGGIELETFCSFPTLESWKVM